MPRNVRNFWIELDVDGKKERVATGPRSSGGGFSMEIKMRDRGAVSKGFTIRGYVDGDSLVLVAEHHGNRFRQLLTKTQRD